MAKSSRTRELKTDHKTPDQPPAKGRILAELRRSPMVGAELDLKRQTPKGRAVDL